jgi:hypothetical protein
MNTILDTQVQASEQDAIVALPLDVLALVGGGDGAVVPF